jgi:hypothetical protein
MVATLLSPREIASSIESVTTMTKLASNIRSGQWDADEMWRIAERLYRDISAKKHSTVEHEPDQDYPGLLAILTLMFYSKDKWGYDTDSREYGALLHLFGALMAALDSWPGEPGQTEPS